MVYMTYLVWVSVSLAQKKYIFFEQRWNGCFKNKAFLHAVKIAIKDTPIIDGENQTALKYSYNTMGLM